LDTAVKYAADEGVVTLAAERQEDGLLVSVCNTGNIAPEHLPHLFERFYKADTAHAEQGTGLGLAIAREIITLLGERIWAENHDGEACFHFTLKDTNTKNA
jgi:two-component system sensor histidine kinase ResE